MQEFVRKPAIQCGLVVALLAALTYGMLTPAGGARATGQGASGTPGTPVAAETRVPPVVRASPAPGTPLPTDPDKAATAAPVASAPATPQVATPTVATRPGPPATPVATPTVSPATVALATPLTATPTRPPGGTVSAAIVRDMSPLAFTLNGREQVAQTTLAVAVTDTAPADRQPGWSLALTIEQFRVADNPARALPMGAVTLLGVTVACVGDTDCTMPQNTVAYPRTMPAGAAVRIATAAPGSGSGQFVVTATFAVRVPAIAYAGSYATRLAVAVAGGAPVLVAQPQGASPTTATAPAAPPPPTGTGTASPPPSPAPVRQTPTSTAPAAPAATPTPASTPEPVVTPEPTVAPAPEPVVTPEPVVVPAPEPTPEATAPAPVAAFPASDRIGTTQAVNLRTGPGVAHASRGHLPQGTSLAATGETRVVAGILWRRFTLADGRTGWVRDIDVLPVAR